jgi:esterase/lipase
VPDLDFGGAVERMKKFSLAGVAERVNCPFLVVHGEHDRIIPCEEAQTLYDALGSKNKTLKIFKAEEGGAEHCQVDDRQAGVNYIADWITANVVAPNATRTFQ